MGRRHNDPAGPKGVETLAPGQRRRFANMMVYRKSVRRGEYGFTIHFTDGSIFWYRHASDVVAAIQAGEPVLPKIPFEIVMISGRKYHHTNWTQLKRPDSQI